MPGLVKMVQGVSARETTNRCHATTSHEITKYRLARSPRWRCEPLHSPDTQRRDRIARRVGTPALRHTATAIARRVGTPALLKLKRRHQPLHAIPRRLPSHYDRPQTRRKPRRHRQYNLLAGARGLKRDRHRAKSRDPLRQNLQRLAVIPQDIFVAIDAQELARVGVGE